MSTEEITALKVGTRVSYEDMANPRRQGTVCDIETNRWGTQYVIAWQDGEVSHSDCRQHGWKVLPPVRPLTRLERASVEPAQLAKNIKEAHRRLACRDEVNVEDVRSTLRLLASRLERLAQS